MKLEEILIDIAISITNSDMTFKEIAEKANVSLSTISSIANRKSLPNLYTILKILNVLSLTLVVEQEVSV
jgi:transcriptional regulator with XRE-family HTH domain